MFLTPEFIRSETMREFIVIGLRKQEHGSYIKAWREKTKAIRKVKDREYYISNRERILERQKKYDRAYYRANTQKVLDKCKRRRIAKRDFIRLRQKIYTKRYYEKFPEKRGLSKKRWYLKNRHKHLEKWALAMKKSRLENPDRHLIIKNKCAQKISKSPERLAKRLAKHCEYVKRRSLIDPAFRLARNLRGRITRDIRKNKGTRKTLELLGCSLDELKRHLESKFLDGMTWATYGRKGWHIDHIIPISRFDLSDPKQLESCFNFKNLQPLWWIDNIIKGNRVPEVKT